MPETFAPRHPPIADGTEPALADSLGLAALRQLPQPVLLIDVAGAGVRFANERAVRLLGVPATISLAALDLPGPGQPPAERIVRRPDGSELPVRVEVQALLGPGGDATGLSLVALHDLSEQQALEAAREEALREVDHRLKNSLQLTASLIGLQAMSSGDERVRGMFEEVRGRVQAIASVHATLYRGDHAKDVDAKRFLTALAKDLGRASPAHSVTVTAADDMLLPATELASLAIAVHELLSNCFKYAYPQGQGAVRIGFARDGSGFRLEVADDGVPFTDDAALLRPASVGFRILSTLARRWDGKLAHQPQATGKAFVLTGKMPG